MPQVYRGLSFEKMDTTRLLPLAFLSPRIVSEVVKGQYPADLTLERLLGCVKLDWRDQAKAIGASH